jgi:hypothetical protein
LPRDRRISAALKAYAALVTSADRGAVRDLDYANGRIGCDPSQLSVAP